MTDLDLVNARGQPLMRKEAVQTFSARASLNTPEVMFRGRDDQLQGAVPNPRRHDWKLYYEMYRQHPIVYAAIQKKVTVATNTGFDIVPRARRKEANEDEAKQALAFFEKINIISELRKIYLDLEIFGDGFLYVIPDRLGRPVGLKRLQPWTVHIAANDDGAVKYFIQAVGEKTVRFAAHEILHFPRPNPDDDIYGMSPLTSLKKVITTDLLAEAFNTNFFANGATTGTILIVKDGTQQQVEMNRKWLREDYVGTENAFKPIVLTGDIEIENVTPSHQDMGFLDGRNAIKKQILAVLDVPPAKIGDMESANRSNSKEQDKSFRTESVMPLQNIVEEVISNGLLRDVMGLREILFKHSEGDIRDAQEQMDLWVAGTRMGFFSINEVRSKMGYAEIEGGQINYIMTPTGAVPVTDMELYFALASPNTDKIPPAMQEGRGFADDTPGVGTTGPMPVFDPNTASQQILPPKTKSVAHENVATFVRRAKESDVMLYQAYAYAVDAVDDGYDEYADVATALRKAVTRDDPVLKHAYIDRATVNLLALERET